MSKDSGVTMDISVTSDNSSAVSFLGEMSNASFLDDSNASSKTTQLTPLGPPSQNYQTFFTTVQGGGQCQYFVPAATTAIPVLGTTQATQNTANTDGEIKTTPASSTEPAFLPVDEVLPTDEIFGPTQNSVFIEPKNPTTTVLAGGETPTTKATNGVTTASSSATVTTSTYTSTGVVNGAYQAAQTVPMAYMDLTKTVDSNAQGNNNEVQNNNPTFLVEAKNYVNSMKNSGAYVGGEIRDPNNPDAPAIFPCPICYHFFTTPSEMANHLEAEHRKFQCDICKKLMSHKRNVDRHRRSVHENQRGFGCPMCPYRSAHKQVRNWISKSHLRLPRLISQFSLNWSFLMTLSDGVMILQVVQRHLVTKHQIKREESPAIPYHAPPIIKEETNRGAFDIKPHPFLHHPYYANPPWLNHHDYQATYFQHQMVQHHYNNNFNMNNMMGGMNQQQTVGGQPMTTIKPELEIQQVNNKITTVIEVIL